ncbi:PilN domain-containing protein [bacterium]|nr:PilN domain-containing protein [candidate division CSSED10-310 bacterium]
MIKINLLPHEKPPDRTVYFQIIGSLVVIIVTITTIGVLNYYFNSRISEKQEEKAQKERTVAQLEVIINQVAQYERDKQTLRSKLDTITNLRNNQRAPVDLLEEVARSLPDHIWLQFIQNVKERVTLRGYSLSLTSIGDFITALENSPAFTNVQFIHSRMVNITGREVYEFELQLKSMIMT